MDNSIYILLSREMGLFRQIDVISDNLANSDTIGFKNKDLLFKEFLVKESQNKKNTFVNDLTTSLNLEVGAIKTTNNPLDIAIDGKGFFRIAGQDGEIYSRAGNFTINERNELVNYQGYNILNDSGNIIQLGPLLENIVIDEKGVIKVNNQEISQIGVTFFDNPKKLAPIGGSLFALGEANIGEEENYRIIAGLEMSNVNKLKELSHTIEVQRSANSTVNLINSIDINEKNLVKALLK